MADFHVDSSGSGSGDGSVGDPWATITEVNAASFSAGDNIYFNRGDTFADTALIPPSSGSSGSPITFGAEGSGANPIIGDTSLNISLNLDAVARTYIDFENLAFEGSVGGVGNDVVRINGDNINFTDCTVEQQTTTGGRTCRIEGLTNSTFTRVTFTNGPMGILGGSPTTADILFDTCTFTGNVDLGDTVADLIDILSAGSARQGPIQFDDCTWLRTGTAATGNMQFHLDNKSAQMIVNRGTFTDNGSSLLHIANPTTAVPAPTSEYNDCVFTNTVQGWFTIRDNNDATFNRCKFTDGEGTDDLIDMASSWPSSTCTLTMNACSLEVPSGRGLQEIFEVFYGTNLELFNCTLIMRNSASAVRVVHGRSSHTGTIEIRNTIIDADGARLLETDSASTTWTLSDNLYERSDQTTDWFDDNGTSYDEGDVPGTFGGSNSVTGDPLFISEDESLDTYFRLNTGSPGIRAGNGTYAPSTDLFGNAFSSPPNIGAVATLDIGIVNPQSTGGGAVTSLTISSYDSQSSGQGILIVGVSLEDATTVPTVTGVTFGGDDLDFAVGQTVTASGFDNRSEAWYFLAPSGTGDVVASFSSAPDGCALGALILEGSKLAAPEATSTGTATASPISNSVTTLTAGAIVIDAVATNNNNTVAATETDQTEQLEDQHTAGGGTLGMSSLATDTAGSTTLGWSASSFGRAAQVLTAWAPAGEDAVAGVISAASKRMFRAASAVAGGVTARKAKIGVSARSLVGAVLDATVTPFQTALYEVAAAVKAAGLPIVTLSGLKLAAATVAGAVVSAAPKLQAFRSFEATAAGIGSVTVAASKRIIGLVGTAGGLVTASLLPRLTVAATAGEMASIGRKTWRGFTVKAGAVVTGGVALAGSLVAVSADALGGTVAGRQILRPISAVARAGSVLASTAEIVIKTAFSGQTGLGSLSQAGRSWRTWRSKVRR